MAEFESKHNGKPLTPEGVRMHVSRLLGRVDRMAMSSPSYKTALAGEVVQHTMDDFPEVIFQEHEAKYGVTIASDEGIVILRKKDTNAHEHPHPAMEEEVIPRWEEEVVLKNVDGKKAIEYRTDFRLDTPALALTTIKNDVRAVEAASRILDELEQTSFMRPQDIV